MRTAGARWLAAMAVLCATAACERSMRDMYDQPRPGPDDASPLFADGKASRAPPEGSVARSMGDLAKSSSGRRGAQESLARASAAAAGDLAAAVAHVTPALLERGRERFDIDCAPCHSRAGDGDGMVARRGFPHPPDLREPRLVEAADRHFFDVITSGYGVMHSYADRVSPEDRWAIVAYVRVLQRTRLRPARPAGAETRP
jgi:mono/diheme cytochrome c family protein